MKVVEHWTYEGFNIVIDAEFEKNVQDYSLNYGLRYYDVVHLRATIYNPFIKKERVFTEDAYAHGEIIKLRFIRPNIVEPVTIHEDYEKKVIELGNWAIDYAKEQIVNKQMTDELPDSLKGM